MNLREAPIFDTDEQKRLQVDQSDSAIKQMWKLGITSTRQPKSIMKVIFLILLENNLEWKLLNEYHIHCRFKNETFPIKLSIQLFKLKNGKFLLDFKKLEGDTCIFFNLCSVIRFRFKELDDKALA